MKLRCLIVDDEFLARQLLEGYIARVPYLELVASCERALDALEVLQKQTVDLILLDVNMPELSGINFIKALPHKPEIILTTAYSEHAIEGYQLDVIEYLLKPIYFERFLQAITKAKEIINVKSKASAKVETNVDGNSFFIKIGPQKMLKIQVKDILYIESLHEYIRIHLANENHTIYHSLKGILEILPAETFIQIHRSYIVNFNHIAVIEGNTITVGGKELAIGKNYRETLMERIKSRSIGITGQR